MPPRALQSAETMAVLRAIADGDTTLRVPCRDTFARQFLGRKKQLALAVTPHALMRGFLETVAPGGYAFAIARTRHFDEAMLAALRSGLEQLVILGAGYDSRAMRFKTELASVRIFELDHPGTQARKRAMLAKAGTETPPNLTLISIDFAKQSFRNALLSHGFQMDQKTLFLWEGVSYYLPVAAVDDVLDFVGRCTAGSSIVFDYALSSFVAGDTSTYGGEAIARWLKKIDEPFLFGLSPAQAPSFLDRHDLEVVAHVGPDDLERLYLARRDGRGAAKTLGHLRIIEGRSTGLSPGRSHEA